MQQTPSFVKVLMVIQCGPCRTFLGVISLVVSMRWAQHAVLALPKFQSGEGTKAHVWHFICASPGEMQLAFACSCLKEHKLTVVKAALQVNTHTQAQDKDWTQSTGSSYNMIGPQLCCELQCAALSEAQQRTAHWWQARQAALHDRAAAQNKPEVTLTLTRVRCTSQAAQPCDLP